MRNTEGRIIRSPFPWYGGKSLAAELVWSRFGDVSSYSEPFAGACGILLNRPTHHTPRHEVINDLDAYIVNAWRAIKADPDRVAELCDYPVFEVDLHARHAWLRRQNHLRDRLTDPDWYCARTAAWWLWGLSMWIGGGESWCSRARQCMSSPSTYNTRGVNSRRGAELLAWMRQLCDRLRGVTILCGDWLRVLGPGSLHRPPVGIVLDPPYLGAGRGKCYAQDSDSVALDVQRWALEHGEDPALRIALCGYDGDYDMPKGWSVAAWKNRGGVFGTNKNRGRERIWFSPHCLSGEQLPLLACQEEA